MVENFENILSPWESESHLQYLKSIELEDLGTAGWFEFHKKLMMLNQQCVLEISCLREEYIKELFITFKKIPVLIFEAIQINVWKHKVFPLLVELNGEPSNTFLLFSVFYHEEMAVSLIENVLYHSESVETMDDSVIDLIDYAVSNITTLLYSQKTEEVEEFKGLPSCLDELMEKKSEIQFDISMKSISILRYLAEFADNMPLGALSRMLTTHDVPYLLAQLIELQPWKKRNSEGNDMVYDGKWVKVLANEQGKICRIEGQVWIGIRELLINPKCAPYYEITEVRIAQLTNLQKYLQESILDQLPPLIDLRRWLSYLNVTSQTSNTQKPILVEIVPEIRSSILEKYRKRWTRLAKHQSKTLFTKDIEHVQNMAKILSDAYDLDKLDVVDAKKCYVCNAVAKKRCSKCKVAWYCGRECQVNDWTNHKDICADTIKAKTQGEGDK